MLHLHLPQPSGRNALAVVRLFQCEFPVIQIGHHWVACGAGVEFTAQAAAVFGVWTQLQQPHARLPGHLDHPLALQLQGLHIGRGLAAL